MFCKVECLRFSTKHTEIIWVWIASLMAFHGGSDSKESACNVGNQGLIPRLGRFPGERNGNPHQYSCLENSMDIGAWWATVHGVVKSRTQLSNFTFFLLSFKDKCVCFLYLLFLKKEGAYTVLTLSIPLIIFQRSHHFYGFTELCCKDELKLI